MVQVIAHQVAGDSAERFLDTGDLRDDVGAVAIVFDHLLQAANLAFDAAQALEVSGFQLRIDTDGFACFGADGTGAVCRCDVLGDWVGGNLGLQCIPPRAIYTLWGYWMSNHVPMVHRRCCLGWVGLSLKPLDLGERSRLQGRGMNAVESTCGSGVEVAGIMRSDAIG
jgi:hypothetical protein